MNFNNSVFIKTLKCLYNVNRIKSNKVHSEVIDMIFKALVMVDTDMDTAKLEMSILTATGIWLDYWGDFFNIPREPHELDEDYAKRIIEEIKEPKVTLMAIKRAAARWLNRHRGTEYTYDDIRIIEPWKQLLMYSHRGTLSGNGKMTDPEYWRYAVIDISLPDKEPMSVELLSYISTIKAAGVQIYYTYKPDWDVIDAYWLENPVLENRELNQFFAYFEMMAKNHGKALYLVPPFEFIGQDDSDFDGGLDDPRHPLSSERQIWKSFGISRDFPQTWGKLKLYEDSSVMSLETLCQAVTRNYSDTTVGQMLIEEDKDNPYKYDYIMSPGNNIEDVLRMVPDKNINTITIGDIIKKELGSHKIYDILYESNILMSQLTSKFPAKEPKDITVEDAKSIVQEYIAQPRSVGKLTNSLPSIQVTQSPILQQMLIPCIKDYNSPIMAQIKSEGFLKGIGSQTLLKSPLVPQDILRYYSYSSLGELSLQEVYNFEQDFCDRFHTKLIWTGELDSYKTWLSELWITNTTLQEFILSELENNVTIINSMIRENIITDNVLLPIAIQNVV